MKVVKKIILTKEELEACKTVYDFYYSDDDIFSSSEDLADFLNEMVENKGNKSFKSMEIEVEE